MNRARSWWLGFGVATAFLIGGLVWISRVTLELEAQNRFARAESTQREQLRDALWTIDGWLGQILDDEADRLAGENWFTPLPGQTFATPLVAETVPFFTCRFESSPTGETTLLPTVPADTPPHTGMCPAPELIAETKQWVDDNDMSQVVKLAEMETCSTLVVPQQVEWMQTDNGPVPSQQQQQNTVALGSVGQPDVPGEYRNPAQSIDVYSQNRRNSAALKARSMRGANDDAAFLNSVNPRVAETGVLLPTWRRGSVGYELILLRRVFAPDGVWVQGLVADWRTLEAELLAVSGPILAGLKLQPLEGRASSDLRWVGCSLATIPVGLILPAVVPGSAEIISPARLALGLTWLAVLGAIAVAFASLRASIAFGERRSRFASAVTHELRTPLTTFQLYSEMLADDMVQDPAQRQEYLETLRDESQRLSGLVESVLAYARLEEGREQRRRETVSVGALIERSRARLVETLERGGLELAIELEAAETNLFTDPDAVGQILSNLVENAAKYSTGSAPARVEITAEHRGGPIEIAVRDFGPGIAPECASRVFEPFDRAGREAGNLPGAGLGLTLSRALARDLGGDLRLDGAVSPGARFVLTLPFGR